MSFRKWYFATNKSALRDAFELLHVAVVSARAHTSLIPICLIEDTDYPAELQSKIDILINNGVSIIKHNAEIFPSVEAVFGKEASSPFNGHWLRTDIPVIEKEDEFVLYTDFDVMFRSDVTKTELHPAFMSCGPEHGIDDWSYFNSGVMLMNLPALRSTREEFFSIVRQRIGEAQPHNDQYMLNLCYGDRYEKLPLSWNWKPYWGFSEEAKIVHFHGPKPGVIKNILSGHVFEEMKIYHEMHDRNPHGYAEYMKEYYSHLSAPLI